jgi:hypothetical protein
MPACYERDRANVEAALEDVPEVYRALVLVKLEQAYLLGRLSALVDLAR